MNQHWTKMREQLKHQHEGKLEFVGESGVAGVIEGKLPNGDVYEWTKVDRKRKKKWRIAKT